MCLFRYDSAYMHRLLFLYMEQDSILSHTDTLEKDSEQSSHTDTLEKRFRTILSHTYTFEKESD